MSVALIVLAAAVAWIAASAPIIAASIMAGRADRDL
jgi:hypothetical protein